MTDDTTTDDSTGAIDHEFDEAVRDARAQLREAYEAHPQTEPLVGSVALDLVTQQILFVRERVADDLAAYYDEEGFDLLNYKMHPYLPVRIEDPVYECVFVPANAQEAHKPGTTYDYPRGRLCHLPVEQAWLEDDD